MFDLIPLPYWVENSQEMQKCRPIPSVSEKKETKKSVE